MIDRQGLHALIDVLLDDQHEIPEPLKQVEGVRYQSAGGPGIYVMLFTCPPDLTATMHKIARKFSEAIPIIMEELSGVARVYELSLDDGPVNVQDKIQAKLDADKKTPPPSMN